MATISVGNGGILNYNYNSIAKKLTLEMTGDAVRYSFDTTENIPPWSTYDVEEVEFINHINIPSYIFYNNATLINVIINDNVITIDRCAFQNCTSLTTIIIPDSVKNIGTNSFDGCTSLASIVIPNNVTSIGSFAFKGCTLLTSVTISSSVIGIASGVFQNCTSLASIILPNVIRILANAFDGCTSLTSVIIPNVTDIEAYVFKDCTSLTSIELQNITDIKYYAFQNCTSLTSVIMPNATDIESHAFDGCTSLASITMSNVTNIESYAFKDCTSLTSIALPNVTSIKDSVFLNCNSLTSVIMPNVTSIRPCAFKDCTSLTSIELQNITDISSHVFDGCTSLEEINLPKNYTLISADEFASSINLKTISMKFYSELVGTTKIVDILNYFFSNYENGTELILKNFSGLSATATKTSNGYLLCSTTDMKYNGNNVIGVTDENIVMANNYKKLFDDREIKNEIIIARNERIELKRAIDLMFDSIYPVGSIYMSVVNTNPSNLFGGTWESWGSGRVPVGVNTSDTDFSTVEKTGGAKTVTLTTSQIPSHSHSLVGSAWYQAQGYGRIVPEDYKNVSSANVQSGGSATKTTGGGGSHNNVQPYITCYMWKRTA